MDFWTGVTLLLIGLMVGVFLLVYRVHERRLATLTTLLAICENRQKLQDQSISGLTAGTVGVDQRLLRLESSETLLCERMAALENQPGDERPYQHAIHLVHQGATAQRLIEELQLSESEAELIVRLHSTPPAGVRADA